MEFKWFLTNIHEQKSYLITIGTKSYCDIKIWGINLTENDIRFKVKGDKYICMNLLRPDIKKINIKLNHRPMERAHIPIHNRNCVEIESYLYKEENANGKFIE